MVIVENAAEAELLGVVLTTLLIVTLELAA